MTNASLRERFGIEKKNSAIVSRMIGDAIGSNLIESRWPLSMNRSIRFTATVQLQPIIKEFYDSKSRA